MPSIGHEWRATAAYLYVLRLGAVQLAWEYLRRNPGYCQDWQRFKKGERVDASSWGLATLEDPHLDARRAWPAWLALPEPLCLTPWGLSSVEAPPLRLWSLAGRKALTRQRRDLTLSVERAAVHLRARIDSRLTADTPFAFAIPAGPAASKFWRLAQGFNALLDGSSTLEVASLPATRRTHLWGLQALDALSLRVPQRQIAAVLLGAGRVERDWTPDSELRAQVRYCLRRAQALMRGGYRSLLGAQGGTNSGARSSSLPTARRRDDTRLGSLHTATPRPDAPNDEP